MTTATFTIGALGDSISVAYNAELNGDNSRHSWVTGTYDGPDASHRQRLGRLFPMLELRTVNAAFNGARAADLRTQVDTLVQSTPDYVTLMIGANDLTRWLFGEYGILLDQFVTDVRSAITRLVAANPRVMILLVAVPDQSRVLELVGAQFKGHEMAAAYLASVGGSSYLKMVCELYRERFQRLNTALADLAGRFSANVRFAGAVAAARFDADHLSAIDSYHPSVKGQQLLAGITWNEGFFP